MEPPRQPVPFGRYLLQERMAQGGMGEVFRAIAVGEEGFEKPVVVKRILPAHAGRSDLLELFIAEAKLMTRLDHPNIVEVLDFGRGEGGEAFLVLELVKGLDLGKLSEAHEARGERFPIPLALFIGSQVLRGLHHAHEQPDVRLVHRDVSPSNVLLSTEGEVKVADFGVALVERPGEREGVSGLVGKPSYMAPEQFDGADVDPRADLFSVGVVLYELFTGALPFEGGTFLELQGRAHRGDFRPASELRPELPAEIDALLRRALSPRREERFADARAMAQAIEGLRAVGQSLATSDDVADAVRAAMRENPLSGRRVVALSGSLGASVSLEDTTLPRELTRIGGAGGVGAFTLRTADEAEAAPRGLGSPSPAKGERAPPVEHRTVRIDDGDREPRAEPLPTAGGQADSDPPEIPIEKAPRATRALVLGAAGLVVAAAVGASLVRSSAPDVSSEAIPVNSADRPAPPVLPVSASPSPVEPSPSPVSPPPLKAPLTRASASPLRAPLPSAAPSSAAPVAKEPAEECEGKVRIASNGSFTVSGGPQTVQSPGVYTFRCGSFALLAVSRADPTVTKQARVTVRRGETATVDLR